MLSTQPQYAESTWAVLFAGDLARLPSRTGRRCTALIRACANWIRIQFDLELTGCEEQRAGHDHDRREHAELVRMSTQEVAQGSDTAFFHDEEVDGVNTHLVG